MIELLYAYLIVGFMIALIVVALIQNGIPEEFQKHDDDLKRMQIHLDEVRIMLEANPEIYGYILFLCVVMWLPMLVKRWTAR